MDILKLIRKRRTIRKYKNKKIPRKILNKIIESAKWAPSPHNSQPWEFIIIKNVRTKKSFVASLYSELNKFLTPVKIILNKSIRIIENAEIIILVYNNNNFSKRINKLGEPYFSSSVISEIEGISAAIENMHLVAYFYGVGMAWLTMPLLLKKNINNFVNTENELIAVLTFGYPAERGKYLKRKNLSEITKYIK